MKAKLIISAGLWAIQWENAARPVFTRFPAAAQPDKVLKAVQRDYPGDTFEAPSRTGWLFEQEELRECEMSAAPLFAEVLP